MDIDWGGLLARKYDIMQQGADTQQQSVDVARQNAATQRIGVDAAAGLDRTRAGLLPAESAANIALQYAQRGLTDANARNVDETTKYVGPLARANVGYLGAQSGEAGARRGLIESSLASVPFTLGQGFKFSADPALPYSRRRGLDDF